MGLAVKAAHNKIFSTKEQIASLRPTKLQKECTEMSEETPAKELSAEEIRIRERRSFDSFNEEQAKRRQTSRDRSALTDKSESARWSKREVNSDTSVKPAENDAAGD